ncbi:SDR family NAD(P)-dependent oxidoreductase [Micromonospora vinacea]|uniref:SDR family NAD(P)-dependent oxidoreductase n=1 Tax=Micromonospora TaxID=1873 RepID=UPI001E3F3428|nr:3-oxoacyl-ACP reductase family protein [Micromonospora vinacea]WSZ78778.1 3-oxoacyl-ACP reductase FabG [Micromonospora sp. NBC_00860]WTA64792.1 3-oxoacyl-ACP reductase FabG [Micromonospora sp. NBC_00855]
MSERPIALVTGASRGIGRAVAQKLAADGFRILVNYRESGQAAEELAEELDGVAVMADVCDVDAVRRLAADVESRFGRLDVLVNNAGATLAGPWSEITPAQWDATLRVNLSGVFTCIQAFAPLLTRSGNGRIVNIGSTYADIGSGFVAGYAAAKAGVVSLTKVFAKELAPSVTVNAIAPGNIDTEMTRSAGAEFLDQVIAQTPLARLGRPEEVAGAVSFLVSETGGFITGQTLVIDGGHRLR